MNAITPLTPEQRAAVVLVSLKPETAGPLADRLGPQGMQRIKQSLRSLAHVPKEDLLGAFALFLTELDSRKGGLRVGSADTKALLRALLGEDESADLVTNETDGPKTTWERFGDLKIDVIADYVSEKNCALGALMLGELPGEKIGEVLSVLPRDISVGLIDALAAESQPTDAARAIAESMIESDLLAEGSDLSNDPKLGLVGEMLGTLPRDLREAALKKLDERDEARAEIVRQKLLSFEDLPERLPTRAVQTVFRDIDKAILVKGLKAAKAQAAEAVEFLMANITNRMSDQFNEDMDAHPDMDERESDRARASLLREILSLNRRGLITLSAAKPE